MNAPCRYASLRVLSRSFAVLLPLPLLLSGALRQISQLAKLDLSENVPDITTFELSNLRNLCGDLLDLGFANLAVILLCQLFRSRYREVLWNLLAYDHDFYAWRVRQEAALLVHNLATCGETDLATHIHVEAFDVFQDIGGFRKREPSEMYEKLREEVDAGLRFKMIQFNAALVAADISWLLDPVHESQHDPRTFSPYCVRSSPTGPREYDFPVLWIGTEWETSSDEDFRH